MRVATGEYFEDLVLARLDTKDGYKPSSNEEDKHKGADFYWYGVPVDVTLNNGKNNVEHIGLIDLACSTLHIGLRLGNGRQHFEEPVLVLCFVPKVRALVMVANDIDECLLEDAISMRWDYEDEVA